MTCRCILVFVAFVERVIRYLSGNEVRGGPHLVDDLIALRTAKEQAWGVRSHRSVRGRPLSLQEACRCSRTRSRAPDFTRYASQRRRIWSPVNPDRVSSDLALIPDDVLAAVAWQATQRPRGPQSQPGFLRAGPYAAQFVVDAMLCLLIAALAESAIGSRYLATFRDEP